MRLNATKACPDTLCRHSDWNIAVAVGYFAPLSPAGPSPQTQLGGAAVGQHYALAGSSGASRPLFQAWRVAVSLGAVDSTGYALDGDEQPRIFAVSSRLDSAQVACCLARDRTSGGSDRLRNTDGRCIEKALSYARSLTGHRGLHAGPIRAYHAVT